MDRRAGLACQHRDQRIGEAAPAEERHLDAAGIMLVGQHADMDAGLRKRASFTGASSAGRDQFAHQRLAQLDDDVADGADIRPPEQHGGFDCRSAWRADGGQFPIGEMRGKADRRLAALRDRVEAFLRFRRIGDDVTGPRAEAVDAKLVEMGEFDGDAAEIVPDAAEDVVSISASDFSGNAARKFSRPIRCSLNDGPILRIKPPAKFAKRGGRYACAARSSPTVSAPATLSSRASSAVRALKTER